MVDAATLAGRYRLRERVASGGMGTVFDATDERLGRRVAVKILREELADDARFVERFRREARAAASLSHPNVAAVFDYGEDAGKHFIVMEFAEGRDLSRLLREEGPLAPARAADMGAQMCDALAHAHAAGIVHRDVKPANVIVSDEGRLKVTDFGIARAAADSRLTVTGSVLGTAQYISPEQAEGGSVTAASDVYSAGVVLYEMLTGSVPFTGDSPVAVAMRHVSGEIPRPSALNSKIPENLDAIVARATEKDPRSRFAHAGEMAEALRGRAAQSAPTRVAAVAPTTEYERPVPLPETRWDPERLGRIVLITLGVLGVVAAVLLLLRIAVSDDDDPRGAAAGTQPDRETETTTPEEPTATPFVLPDDLIGSNYDDAFGVLQGEGLKVIRNDVDPEELGYEDVEEGIVFETDPDVGTEVTPGDTVTLFVSLGSDDEESEDSDSGPGNSENAPGHEKKDKKEEDD